MDATSLRKYRVRKDSLTFKDQIKEWKLKHKGKRLPPYFLCYIRVFGMSQRGTNRFCFVKAPLKLVPRGAKPPVESVSEVLQSKLLTKIRQNSQCFTDGCLSWESAAKKMKKTLKFEQVKHCRSQFTRKLRGKRKPGQSKVAGTQQIDKLWTWCKGFICGRVKTRINGLPNPQLYNQAYQYVWRKNNVEKDLFKLLATELHK